MRYSDSLLEFMRMNVNLNLKKKRALRIADFCAYVLYKNKNYSMTARELMDKIIALGYKSDGQTLDRTISTINRYQNYGLFDKPRNSKFRLKKSIVNKMKKRSFINKVSKVFPSKKR